MSGLIVDLFAGGGGVSTGIERALGRSPDVAVNHDPQAVSMHRVNHPTTRHLTANVHDISPRSVVGGCRVSLLWASPDCTYHSKARGGKPFRDPKSATGRRGLAWVVVRWARDVRPDRIFLENVEEFANWGPLGADGRPDPTRAGLTFRRWVGQLRAIGYTVEWRELRACDYGAPTTRKRLFVIASLGAAPVWPEPTHGPGRLPYGTAASCIDWSFPTPSIFDRRKSLAEKTLARIVRGLRRFVFAAAEPFIVRSDMHQSNAGCAYPIGDPLRTVTTANGHALVTPFISEQYGTSTGRRADSPLSTVTAGGIHHALVAPTLIHSGNGERVGQAPRVYDLHEPITTVMAEGVKHALVSAFVSKQYGGHESTGSDLRDPLHTVTTSGQQGVVEARLEAPDRRDNVRALLARFPDAERPSKQTSLFDGRPSPTARRVRPEDVMDIGFRMLQPRELFRAQGFPDSYQIDHGADGESFTQKAQIRMCGNSVCPAMAAAIVRANVRLDEEEVAAE